MNIAVAPMFICVTNLAQFLCFKVDFDESLHKLLNFTAASKETDSTNETSAVPPRPPASGFVMAEKMTREAHGSYHIYTHISLVN